MDKPQSFSSVQHVAPPPARSAAFPRRRNSRLIWAVALALLAAGLLPIAGLGLAAAYFKLSGVILPGVSAGGVSVGSMTREQAAQAVDRAWNQDRKLVLVDGARQWEAAPAFLGLWVDPSATVQAAYEVGRGPDAFSELVWLVQQPRWEIVPVVTVIDPAYSREQLARWAALVGDAPQNASLRLEGDRVVITPGQPGSTLDVDAALLNLLTDPRGVMQSGVFTVPFVPVAPALGDVTAAAAQAEALLSRPLQVRAYDPVADEHFSWEAGREDVANWLRLEAAQDGPRVSFDPTAAGVFIEGLAADLGSGRAFAGLPDAAAIDAAFRDGQPLSLRVRYLPGEYVVQPGDTLLKIGWKVGMPFWRVLRANPGLDENTLTVGQTLVIPPLDEQLPLPVVENKRIIIDINDQRMSVYQDGGLLQEYVISTGIDRSPTQPGIYQIQTHEVSAYASMWDLTMPHFMGIYEAWPGFMNGIHGLPTLSNGRRLWADILGRPASYGCIILDLEAAEWLFGWAEDGVVVQIQ